MKNVLTFQIVSIKKRFKKDQFFHILLKYYCFFRLSNLILNIVKMQKL